MNNMAGDMTTKRLIVFLAVGCTLGSVILSIISPATGNILYDIIRNGIVGIILAICLGCGITFGVKLTLNSDILPRAIALIICGTIGGIIGYLIYGIIPTIFIISIGGTLSNIIHGLVDIITKSAISIGCIMIGIVSAGIITRGRNQVIRSITFSFAGIIGGFLAEFIQNASFSSMNLSESILGMCIALAIATADKDGSLFK